MADKQPAKSSKRRVKNPETFRERALKAAETADQPKRSSQLKKAGHGLLKPVFKPIGQALVKLFDRQPFKLIGKALSFIGKIIFPTYFRNAARELRLVTWPTKRQSRQLTFAVLVFATIFGAVIALVDYGLDKVFKQLLLK